MNPYAVEMMKAMEGDLSCSVCKKLLTAPVLQCKRGHNTCSGCKKEDRCLLCKEPFLETTNALVDKMMNLLSKPCRYADQGCTALASGGHEQWCTYRVMQCPQAPLCTWEGPLKSWVSHPRGNHLNRGVLLLNKTTTFPTEMFFNLVKRGCVFEVGDSYFFLYADKGYPKHEFYNLTLKCFPTKQVNEKYCFKIVFTNKNDETLDTVILKPRVELEDEFGRIGGVFAVIQRNLLDDDTTNNKMSITVTAA